METNNKLNKSFSILYIILGSIFMFDVILDIFLIIFFQHHAWHMYNVMLMALCEVALFIVLLIFGINTLKKGEDSKGMLNLHLTIKLAYGIAFLVNAIGWSLYFTAFFSNGGFMYLVINSFYAVLFVGLIIFSIVGKVIKDQRIKAIFNIVCSVINILASLVFICLFIGLIIWGWLIPYAVGLLLFIAIDILIIVMSSIEIGRLKEETIPTTTLKETN